MPHTRQQALRVESIASDNGDMGGRPNPEERKEPLHSSPKPSVSHEIVGFVEMIKPTVKLPRADPTRVDIDSQTGSSKPDENVVEIVRRAAKVLGAKHVAQWMRTEIASLGNKTPYSLIETKNGRKEVERVLLKIEHGVY